jgi:hypothetical protein
MLSTVTGTELVHAYQILFRPMEGSAVEPFSLSFVMNLDPSIVKNAFRKRAFETHPDRAHLLGRAEGEQADLFRQVIKAYEVLMPVAEKSGSHIEREETIVRKDEKKYTRPARPQTKPMRYYTGSMPRHRMRFGHYLYYNGTISWQELIGAVAFQMRSSQRYGSIAVDWNMINHDILASSLRGKMRGEKIGECLRRAGLISDFQHLAILGKQRRLHRLFGEYFVSHGILTREQIDALAEEARQYNKTFRF